MNYDTQSLTKIFTLSLTSKNFSIGFFRKNNDSKKPVNFEVISVDAAGFKNDILVNYQDACAKLQSLVELLENEKINFPNSITLGIPSSSINVRRTEHIKNFKVSKTITDEILEEIDKNAKINLQSINYEIINLIPIRYKINNRPWIKNPTNFSGSQLAIEYLVLEVEKSYLSDLVKLCNSNGLRVDSICSNLINFTGLYDIPFGKNDLILDFGYDTTTCCFIKDGKILEIMSLNVGEENLINDLSIAYNLSKETAESIFSIFLQNPSNLPSILEKMNLSGINLETITTILHPRINEITGIIYNHIYKKLSFFGGNIYICGEPTFLERIKPHLKVLLQAQITDLTNLSFKNDVDSLFYEKMLPSTLYCASIALQKLHRSLHKDIYFKTSSLFFNKIISSLKFWLSELS